MGNLRPFQIVLLALFAALAVGSLVLLGTYQARVAQQAQVYGDSVTVWGTFDQRDTSIIFNTISSDIGEFTVVTYQQIREENFTDELIDALAEGRGPDIILLPSSKLVTLRSKLWPIPYENLPLRTFRDTYVDGAEIFTYPEGVYGFPIALDPLMLYWNRDLFASNGLANPPRTWEEVVNSVVPTIALTDERRNIILSALAFGEYRNVTNAKATLLALALQSGSRMIYLEDGQYVVDLEASAGNEAERAPFLSAVEFFTNFSNSNSPLYNWNRIQPTDKNAFLAGDLAMYFGFASEYADLAEKNPNLNFDVTTIPQGSTATIKRTYGEFYGLAILNTTDNSAGAYQAMLTLTSSEYAGLWNEQLGLITPRRDVLAQGASDPALQATMNAALIARGWLDPNSDATEQIFSSMIEDIVSNRVRISVAVRDALDLIRLAF